ncbi:SRPBCC family protein [Pontibacter lucknowensis]|uniref:Polyketide cyclase / dehydrase and lipid transport n=1 Tax=Pontibacter lucknowensis TaxID=1077936 RepID=A0A1N6WG19_9BACT|nr:SRPBCC family protein [Pontibacter lucknowensis]SIQ89051.1 Polyketide cyclase / dehydrase and lipid transport [Pontibacter lucknowensis]
MHVLKSFLLGAVTLIAILGVISISLPRQIHLQRDIIINAPADVAYEQLSDLRNWPNWLPGHHIDTGKSLSYAGPPIGARYNWTSQRRGIGQGIVTIVAAEPPSRLVTNLEFEEDDKAHSTFVLEETEEGTKLTWHFDKYMGDNPVRKFSGLLIDSTVGEEFEDGLENIKKEVEARYVLSDK